MSTNTLDILIVHPTSNEKLEALTAFMNALHIPFERTSFDSPYRKEYVDMILKGDEDKKNGKGKKITVEELDQLWK